jgi:opacity protein-like surface antigen
MRVTALNARILLSALVIAPALASSASAQTVEGLPQPRPSRAAAGLSFVVAQPIGQFRDNVSSAFGGEGHVVLRRSEKSVLGLRLEGGFLNYGHEHKRVPLSSTIGDRIQVDLNTNNNIALFGAGPQLMVPSGPIRPYVHGTAGFAYFFTESHVDGSDDTFAFAQTTNHDDAAFAYGGGAGVIIPLPVRRTLVSIDLGARYLNSGTVSYLKEGGIRDNSDGSITLSPSETKASMITYRVGVSVGLPGGR